MPVETCSPLTVIVISTSTGLDLVEGAALGAEDVEAAGGVVGDGVAERDVPVGDRGCRRSRARRRRSRPRRGTCASVERPVGEVRGEDEGDLGLGLRLQQPAHRDDVVLGVAHVVEEHAEVGLVDAELLLHRLARSARSCGRRRVAPAASRAAVTPLLDGVRRDDVVGADQVADRRARHPRSRCLEQPGGGLDDVRRARSRASLDIGPPGWRDGWHP